MKNISRSKIYLNDLTCPTWKFDDGYVNKWLNKAVYIHIAKLYLNLKILQ